MEAAQKLNTPVQGTAADRLKRVVALGWERWEECPGVALGTDLRLPEGQYDIDLVSQGLPIILQILDPAGR
jgi:hypothetical protein